MPELPPLTDPERALYEWQMWVPGVGEVHDLHVWPLSTTEVALTAHLVRPGGADDDFLHAVCEQLNREFGIAHATLQIETDGMVACQSLHA